MADAKARILASVGVRFSAGVIGTGRGYAAFRAEYLARFGIRYGLPRPRFWSLCLPP